uniref:J domain-containing protein n=1 Tax=viral metagenome TaxID=1070528 RepID=A0A6C0HM62_9ZZZZ
MAASANPPTPTHYDVLGLNINTKPNDEQIRKAYYKQARIVHPDRCSNRNQESNAYKSANAKFKTLGSAYAILRDPAQKKQYNLSLLQTNKKSYPQYTDARGEAWREAWRAEHQYYTNLEKERLDRERAERQYRKSQIIYHIPNTEYDASQIKSHSYFSKMFKHNILLTNNIKFYIGDENSFGTYGNNAKWANVDDQKLIDAFNNFQILEKKTRSKPVIYNDNTYYMCRDKQYKNAIGLLINYKYAGIIINIDNIKFFYSDKKQWYTPSKESINIYLNYITVPMDPINGPLYYKINKNNDTRFSYTIKSDDNQIILQKPHSYPRPITDNLSIIYS